MYAVHGSGWNLSAADRAVQFAGRPAPPTTEAQLRADLMSTSPEYDTIDLPANTTIVITQPLEITHSVQIVGNNATLLFQRATRRPGQRPRRGRSTSIPRSITNIQLDNG